MRIIGLLVLAGLLGGCTTVKVLQRDGCWIRETKRTLGGTKQDVGPCVRDRPEWADDRLTRLVQECVAQVDHRWQVRAVAAWNRGEPLPAQEPEESVIASCLSQTAIEAVTTNDRLEARLDDAKKNLAEMDRERAALRAESAQARDDLRAESAKALDHSRTESAKALDHLRASNDRIADALAETAKRPPPVATATATATSDGTAVTESGLQSETGAASHTVPATGAVALPFVPVAAPLAAAQPAPSTDAGAPEPRAAQPSPEPLSAQAPAAEPAAPPKRAPRKAQARKKPLVRATSAAPCEVPAAMACEAPAGGPTGGMTPPSAGEAPPPAPAAR